MLTTNCLNAAVKQKNCAGNANNTLSSVMLEKSELASELVASLVV